MTKKISSIFALSLISIVFISTLVSAWSFGGSWGSYSLTPERLLENPWMRFGLIMVAFTVLIFFALSRAFKGNAGPAIVIALVISFPIAAILAGEFSYIGVNFKGWVVLAAVIIGIFALIAVGYSMIGVSGVFLALFLSLAALRSIDLEYWMPYEILDGPIGLLLYALTSWLGLFVIGIIMIVVMAKYKFKKPKIHRSFEEMFYGKD